jgi:hypothetical protein
LDELHLRKIDLADEIFVLNVDGYVGESTRREIEYAKQQGKQIRWLEETEQTCSHCGMRSDADVRWCPSCAYRLH